MNTSRRDVDALVSVYKQIEDELTQVEAAYKKYEGDDMPDYYKDNDFGNILAGCCFWDMITAVVFDDRECADKFVKRTKAYLQKCLKVAGAYKPVGAWRGAAAEMYYPLQTATCLFLCEFMDAYKECWI